MRQRRSIRILVTAVLAGALTAGSAAAAEVVDLKETAVPANPADSTVVKLYGSSPYGSAVGQTGSGVPRIVAGPSRSELAPTADQGGVVDLLGTVGPISAWTATEDPDDANSTLQLRRLNVATGAETVTVPVDEPVAATRDGWIGYHGGRLTGHTMSGRTKQFITGLHHKPQVVADATRALVASDYTDATTKKQIFQLRLITLSTGKIRTIVSGTKSVSGPALSPTTIAWLGPFQSGTDARVINQRGRDGGKITSFLEPNYIQSPIAIAGTRVGWLSTHGNTWYIRVFTGSKAVMIDLPGRADGIAGVGARLVTAVSGKLSTAGVYAVGKAPERVATVAPESSGYRFGSMSAGRIWLTDTSLTDRPGAPIWQRDISGSSKPVLSKQILIGDRAGAVQSVSLSAGRALSGGPGPLVQFQMFDRGKVTHRRQFSDEEESGLFQASGPYFRFAGAVYDAAGKELLNAYALGGDSVQLYGSRLAYATREEVLVRDVSRPVSSTNPVKVADCLSCQYVTIWGNTVAWMNRDGQLKIRRLDQSTVRTVEVGLSAIGAKLAEGSIVWSEQLSAGNHYLAHALDLTSPTSEPIDLGPIDPLSVDGHWVLAKQTQGRRTVSVLRLPFGQDQPGRLIGTFAAATFSPAGSAGAVWAPEFDISKPMVGVELRISTAGGPSVRTLSGTAPDGSVRDLSWDGRDVTGALVPAGDYTWTLSARNQDGEGRLINVDGGSTVSGTVTVTR